MTDNDTSLDQYFNRLTDADREQLERRLKRYHDQLEAQGCEPATAEGTNGFHRCAGDRQRGGTIQVPRE